jgi:hypothetical protein
MIFLVFENFFSNLLSFYNNEKFQKEIWNNRENYYLSDGINNFFENDPYRLNNIDYIPTLKDLLSIDMRSSQINKFETQIQNFKFSISTLGFFLL